MNGRNKGRRKRDGGRKKRENQNRFTWANLPLGNTIDTIAVDEEVAFGWNSISCFDERGAISVVHPTSLDPPSNVSELGIPLQTGCTFATFRDPLPPVSGSTMVFVATRCCRSCGC